MQSLATREGRGCPPFRWSADRVLAAGCVIPTPPRPELSRRRSAPASRASASMLHFADSSWGPLHLECCRPECCPTSHLSPVASVLLAQRSVLSPGTSIQAPVGARIRRITQQEFV